MSTVLGAPELAAVEHDRTALWDKLVADPELAALSYRIETDEHGQIILSPPPAPSHGSKQSSISIYLKQQLPVGRSISECPISTRKGVKAADVAWCSPEIWEESKNQSCFVRAPEICVEILSPSNSKSEIEEKKALYFDAGAAEVWICEQDGTMRFFFRTQELAKSPRCPDFPALVD